MTAGAGRPDDLVGHAEVVMGTVVSFVVNPGDRGRRDVAAGLRRACADLHRVDEVFSTWQDASPVSRLRRGEIHLDAAPAEVAEVLRACAHARAVTGGLFDPWAVPGGVDPSGYVKGWAAGRARDLLAAVGVAGALVSAGGDIATMGAPGPGRAWRIGIRHPWRADALACVIEPGPAVATSGSYERGAHLVDPRRVATETGAVASATVVGPDAGLVDAFATAAAVGGLDGIERWLPVDEGYGAYVVGADGSELVVGVVTIVDPSEVGEQPDA